MTVKTIPFGEFIRPVILTAFTMTCVVYGLLILLTVGTPWIFLINTYTAIVVIIASVTTALHSEIKRISYDSWVIETFGRANARRML